MRSLALIPLLALAIGATAAPPALRFDDVLDAAVAASPTVAAADAHVREMQDEVRAAGANASPALTTSYNQVPQGAPDGSTISQRLTTIGGAIDLGNYVTRDAAVAAASAELRSAQFSRLDAIRAERIKTIGLVFDLLRTQADSRLRQGELAGARADLDAARRRYAAGDAPHIDITRADVALSEALADKDAADVALENARDALSAEAGRPVDDVTIDPTTLGEMLADRSTSDLVATALRTRPDVRAAQSDEVAAEAAARQAALAALPSVSASVGYTNGTDAGVLVHGPSASVTMSFPVSARSSSETDAARARVVQAQARMNEVRRSVELDVPAKIREVAMLRSSLRHARAAERAASEELHAIVSGYASGASSSLDVAEARRTFAAAELQRVHEEYALQQALTTLREIVSP